MTDKDAIPPPPEGFKLSEHRPSGFSYQNGPFFDGPMGEGRAQRAFYSRPQHANGFGLVHGGMLSAFMDALLARAVFNGAHKVGLTVHISIDYLHMARIGEWVIGESRLTRATRDIAFAEGRLYVGERDVARATGIFKLSHRQT